MARTFVSASTQFLQFNGIVDGTFPITMACWFKSTSGTAQRNLMCMGANAGAGELQLQQLGNVLHAYGFDGVTLADGNAGSFSDNVWNHAVGVFTGTTSTTGYLNGVGGTTATTAYAPTISPGKVTIGAQDTNGTRQFYFGGDIAEAAIWNISLSAADIASLALGVSPSLIRPDALVAYWPLVGTYSPEIDVRGKNDMVVTGATQGTHPRIFYPNSTVPFHGIPPTPPPDGKSILFPNPVRRTASEAWRWTEAQALSLPLFQRYFPLPTDAVVVINGVDVSLSVDLTSLSVNDNINEEPNTCNFRVRTNPGIIPTVGNDVHVGLGSIDPAGLLFAGTIVNIEQGYDQTGAYAGNILWDVTCVDYTFLLNRRRPYGVFTAVSATTVFTTLMASYSSGFTLNGVPAGLPSVTITFDGNQTLAQCFTSVCNLIGYHWDVSYTKDVSVYTVRSGTAPATVNISNTAVQANPKFTYALDLGQIRTRVVCVGPVTSAVLGFISGDTGIAIVDATSFSASGGSGIASRGPSTPTTDVFTYTGKVAGATTTATTTGDPALNGGASLSVAFPAGSVRTSGNIRYTSGGVVSYRVRFGTATGEATPQAISTGTILTITTGGGGTAADHAGGSVTSGTHDWSGTLVTANGESAAFTTSNVVVSLGAILFTNPSYGTTDARILGVNWYVTLAGGGTKYFAGFAAGSAGTFLFTTADANINQGKVIPSVGTDNWDGGTFLLTSISTSGDPRVTKRIISRTLSGGSVYYDIVTIGDNTTTSYTDNIPDSAMGNAAPSVSTVSVPIGKNIVPITDLAQVAASGFVTVGSQVVKYTGRSAGSGAGNLTGVPTSGTGSVTSAISSGTAVAITAQLTGVSGLVNTALVGASVAVRVQKDDAAAQAALALLEGGDGIHEYQFTSSDTTEAHIQLEAQSQLDLFKTFIIKIVGGIRDVNVQSGKTLTVSLGVPMSITAALLIQTVRITRIGQDPGQLPLYTLNASSVKYTFQDLMRQLNGLLTP